MKSDAKEGKMKEILAGRNNLLEERNKMEGEVRAKGENGQQQQWE